MVQTLRIVSCTVNSTACVPESSVELTYKVELTTDVLKEEQQSY